MASETRTSAVLTGEPPAPADRTAAGRQVSQAGEVRNSRVESIRGTAALAVLLTHVYAFTHLGGTWSSPFGHLMIATSWSVYVFFALSGYLIFLPFARRWWGGRDSVNYTKYGINRALRILPIYWAVVIIYTAWHRDAGSWSQIWRFLLFWENYSIHTIYRVDGPMWSLVDELDFYLLLPFLAALVALISRRSRKGAATCLLALGIASGTARVWFWVATTDTSKLIQFHHQGWYLWIVSLPLTFCYFVPGMLLALVRIAWEERRPVWTNGLLGRGELWFVAGIAVMVIGCASSRVGAAGMIAVIGSFLIVGGVVLPFERIPRLGFLDFRPFVLVGLASYSFYLLHQPLVELLAEASWYPNGYWALLLGSLVICCSGAAIGYSVIERPFLSLRRVWASGRAAS